MLVLLLKSEHLRDKVTLSGRNGCIITTVLECLLSLVHFSSLALFVDFLHDLVQLWIGTNEVLDSASVS